MEHRSNEQDTGEESHISDDGGLNPSQREAVYFNNGHLLVIAGAGSGKTRTLTYRVVRLVEDGVSPRAILLLTFTRKAAAEMIRRAVDLLDDRCSRVSGGTFHSLANTLLRRYASKIGFDQGFAILDRADAESLVGMLRKENDDVSKFDSFPRKSTLVNIFSRAVNKVISVEDEIDRHYPHFEFHMETILSIGQEYKKRKIQLQYLDYDDLLVRLKMLLEEHPDIRDTISSSYRYIMVDEYQDTNKIQADIVYRLAFCNHNVMAVGDDSQSIYAFRGANFKNIMTFPDIFPDTKIVRLEENYRSVQPILDFTNVLIDKAKEKYTKYLFTRRTGGSTPKLVEAGSENDQSRFIVEKIMELYRDGIPFQEIAVLFRAGFHSFDLEIELNREGIAFIKYGGFKFMESAHIKDFLAHLRVLLNPNDRISWHRILLLLNKVGPRTADKIFRAIVNEKAGSTGLLTIAPKAGWARGFERLKGLFSTLDSQPMPILEMGETIFAYYEEILKEKYDDHPKRIRDLEHLLTIMPRYNDLEPFLTDMALEPPNASADANLSIDDTGEDRLVLSTVHSAKGLEWHTVFVIWALDGRFPSLRAMDSEEELEEERRLMYVAATRAREHLFFTYPGQVYDRGSGMMFSEPSRFLDDMPFEILERTTADSW